MNRRNAAVAAIEVLQVGLTIQIRVPQLDDRIVGAVESFELRRQRRRDGGQVVAADVERSHHSVARENFFARLIFFGFKNLP